MARVPEWVGRLGAGLSEMGERRSRRAESDDDFGDDARPARQSSADDADGSETVVPAPPAYAPDVAARP
ncbi:MAG: AI-2E family transporter, partial [Streptomyces sp.]